MKCTSKEWDTCREEKLGCSGCHYNRNVEVNCFAYRERNGYEGCYCLHKLYCKKEECRFYKHKDEIDLRQIERDIRNYMK